MLGSSDTEHGGFAIHRLVFQHTRHRQTLSGRCCYKLGQTVIVTRTLMTNQYSLQLATTDTLAKRREITFISRDISHHININVRLCSNKFIGHHYLVHGIASGAQAGDVGIEIAHQFTVTMAEHPYMQTAYLLLIVTVGSHVTIVGTGDGWLIWSVDIDIEHGRLLLHLFLGPGTATAACTEHQRHDHPYISYATIHLSYFNITTSGVAATQSDTSTPSSKCPVSKLGNRL